MSAKAKATDLTHHGDAAIAVERFFALLPDPTSADVLDAPFPISLIGAAMIWSGWSDDVGLLQSKCLVVKALAHRRKSTCGRHQRMPTVRLCSLVTLAGLARRGHPIQCPFG